MQLSCLKSLLLIPSVLFHYHSFNILIILKIANYSVKQSCSSTSWKKHFRTSHHSPLYHIWCNNYLPDTEVHRNARKWFIWWSNEAYQLDDKDKKNVSLNCEIVGVGGVQKGHSGKGWHHYNMTSSRYGHRFQMLLSKEFCGTRDDRGMRTAQKSNDYITSMDLLISLYIFCHFIWCGTLKPYQTSWKIL